LAGLNRFGRNHLGEENLMRNQRRLANVPDPQGRLDVALFRMVDLAMERIEREQGLAGLREHLLPIVEQAILQHVPGRNLIPREIAAVLRVCELNRGRS
jgi:hypothetical protein